MDVLRLYLLVKNISGNVADLLGEIQFLHTELARISATHTHTHTHITTTSLKHARATSQFSWKQG